MKRKKPKQHTRLRLYIDGKLAFEDWDKSKMDFVRTICSEVSGDSGLHPDEVLLGLVEGNVKIRRRTIAEKR